MDIISIDNLTQVFSSGHQSNIVLLNNLSLKFTNMSLVAITGKSGCGKSTLLNCLYGLLKPTKGRISFLGNDIYKMKEKGRDNYRNKYISMVFQHYNLFDDFTSIENVILPLLIKGIKKNKATKKAKELFIKYKIEHLINKKIKNLSGGEKQRIAILRSLIQDPLVLLCDEPTGALDEENSLMVMNILKEISKQKLVIFVSHNEKLVSLYADRIISLKNGKIERDVVNKTLIDKQNITEKYQISKIKNERLSKMFVKKNIRKDKGKNILSLLTSSFGFSMVILSYGFNVSTNINKDKLIFKNADVFNATLSTKHYVEIPNYSLLLEKSSSPNNDEINYFKSYCHDAIVKQNYDYFFPNYCSLSVDKKIITNFEFIPVYNNSLIGESIFKSISDVIINSKAKELINNSKNIIVFNEKEIKNIDNDGNIIKDNFSFSFKLNVKDSIEEFSFLNTPKIYYSYKLFEDYISEFKLENLSSVYNEDIFLIDYINTSNDDSINNYSKRIFFENIESVNKAKEFKNKNIVLESKALEINNTYVTYVDSFSKAFTYFSIISFVMLNLIIGIISISTYIENKRENAILRSLGYSLNNILKIYVKSNALIVFTSVFISLINSYLIFFILDNLICPLLKIGSIIILPISFSNINDFLVIIFIYLIGIIISLFLF